MIDAGRGLVERGQVEVIGGRLDKLQRARSATRLVKGDRPGRLHQVVEEAESTKLDWIQNCEGEG